MAITANPRGSWSERNITDIADCMDTVFANVLSSEFDRLTVGMSQNQINAQLARSDQSINLLRSSGDMPDYSDPMVVLRYVILYQLGHINLAYTLIKDGQRGQRLTDTGALQVVDFGAGTLAVSFGVALAIADALADGESISAVRIDAIDTGGPMMELGLKLWTEFVSEVGRRRGMEHLTQAAQLMQHSLHDSHRSVQEQGGRDCWLTALHTLYDNNEAVVRFALTTLCGTLNPDFIALSCYAGKSNIANRVAPTGRSWQQDRDPELRFNGSIDTSRSTNVAFDKGFNPSTWYRYNRRLYTDCYDVATFISRVQVSRPASTPSQLSEQERQQRQQEEARRRAEPAGVGAGGSRQQSSDSQSSGNATSGATGSNGCLLPVLGATFFGVASVVGAYWMGVSLLG